MKGKIIKFSLALTVLLKVTLVGKYPNTVIIQERVTLVLSLKNSFPFFFPFSFFSDSTFQYCHHNTEQEKY